MSQVVNKSLHKIAKGTAIVFFATTIGMLFSFGSRVLVARFFSQSQYGIFSLAWVILNIAVVVSTLGFQQGATRQIAYYRGKAEAAKVQGIISSSLQIAVTVSILISSILFFSSGIISTQIFHEPGLALALKIFSIAIPFFVLIQILAAIFLGFDDVKPKAYFQDILVNGLFPLLLLPVILLSLSFSIGIFAFLASIVITAIAFIIYTIKRAPFHMKRYPAISPISKELLLFSLPLLSVAVFSFTLNWTDTLMLGYFKTAEAVGFYNAAIPLAWLISLPLASMGFIYIPIVSQLYSQNLVAEMKRTYQVLTKWIFAASFPLFLLLFLFPEAILSFFFGAGYTEAAMALRILSLGIVFNAFLGANGITLVVLGKTKLVMWGSLLATGLNIVLNVILIPRWDITGAAIASFTSFFARNIFFSVTLFQLSKIQPFAKSYLKPLVTCSGIIAIIYVLTRSLLVVSYWMLPLIFILFVGVYCLCLVLTKSFDKEDITMLLTVERRLGINLTALKKILRRFL
jgi:O-antigen/teichoic acid export membrane protein